MLVKPFGICSVDETLGRLQDADGEQREDVRHVQKALVDLWVLSLRDILLTSHMSTFGYTAHGLAGITPYHLKPWLDLPCWPSVSSDPCFHFAPQRVHCPADNFTMRDPFQQAPYLTKCPDLPDTGLQLAE
jgi:xyloglucan fucosyltransferase